MAWKESVVDLERRLPGLPAGGGPVVEAWRSDAEALRSSLASYADIHPHAKLQMPEPLPEPPSSQVLAQQLSALMSAVDEIIRQNPARRSGASESRTSWGKLTLPFGINSEERERSAKARSENIAALIRAGCVVGVEPGRATILNH